MTTVNYLSKTRWVFYSLLLLFAVPLMVATWMVMHEQPLSSHTTNHGQLIQPPLDMANLHLTANPQPGKGHWLLVYVNPTVCDKSCETALYHLRQIRTATGKDADRVQRAILTFNHQPDGHLADLLATQYPGTLYLSTTRPTFKLFAHNSVSSSEALQKGGIYLADPLGNVMLFYSLQAEPMGIFKDLTRLLKLSQIG